MGRPKKRTRNVGSKLAGSGLHVREILREKDGKTWVTNIVQGWKKADGTWGRKQFKDRADAERFMAAKRVELENEGRKQQMIMTPLTEKQAEEAVAAFDALGETYTLKEAVDFFLKNHRPPEYTTTLSEGLKLFLDDKEREGNRERTIRGTKGVLSAFAKFHNDPEVHTVTPQMVQSYLRNLRAKDGVSPAKRKSWNTHRNELSQFFVWSAQEDLSTSRPWCFTNPVENIRVFTARQIAEERPAKATTAPERVCEILTTLMNQDGGKLVKFFALSYFAGIRPEGELEKLSEREEELINLKTGRIFIPAAISKTKAERQIVICENLRAWLEATKGQPIIPVNFKMLQYRARKHFDLQRDETRHSFISFHVALHRSIGDAALQAGNSESMVKKHYLNLHERDEGEAFFSIMPDLENQRASIATGLSHPEPGALKAI